MTWPPIDTPPNRLYPPYAQHYRPGEHPSQDEYRAALLDALAGVDLGIYDLRIVDWLAGYDASTVAVVVSLIHRVREAGSGPS